MALWSRSWETQTLTKPKRNLEQMASRTLASSKMFSLYFRKHKGFFSATWALSIRFLNFNVLTCFVALASLKVLAFFFFLQCFHANCLLLRSQSFTQRILLGIHQFSWVIFFLEMPISILVIGFFGSDYGQCFYFSLLCKNIFLYLFSIVPLFCFLGVFFL